MKYKSLIFLFLFGLFLTGCISDGEEKLTGANISVNDKLPVFSVELAGGTTVTNNSLDEKVSVILFFTTKCGDCQEQLPVVEKLYNLYKDNTEVIILGITRADGAQSVSKYWKSNSFTFPYSPQDDRTVFELFASHTVPRIYISDKNQIVRFISTDNPKASLNQLVSNINDLLKK